MKDLTIGFLVLVSVALSLGAQETTEVLVLPNVISGEIGDTVFETYFSAFNPRSGGIPAQVRIQLYSNDGEMGMSWVLSIDSMRSRSSGFFYHPFIFPNPLIPPDFEGWAEIRRTREETVVQGTVIATAKGEFGKPFTTAHEKPVVASRSFRAFLPAASRPGTQRALAIVNPSPDEDAQVHIEDEIEWYSDCPKTILVPARHRVSQFVEGELCGHSPTSGRIPPGSSSLLISSDIPVAVSALEFFPSKGVFSTLPVESLEN